MSVTVNKDPEAARKQQELFDFFRAQEIDDIKKMMSCDWGRRIMNRHFRVAKPLTDPNTGNSQTYWNCGARAMALTFLGEIVEHCPELWLQAMADERKRLELINNTIGVKS